MMKDLLVGACLCAWTGITPAMAQQQTSSGDGAPVAASRDAVSPGQSDDGVTDIIVTAQRIAQPLQRVPISVQPVSGKELENRKLNDIIDLQTAVPSLAVGVLNSVSLRGVGSASFAPNVDSSVGVSIDNVSLGVPLYMNYFSFEDVERVEVLNGPQGLLFGRNASAGLLNIVTARPELDRASGRVYAEGDYRDSTPGGGWGKIVRATVNLPVGTTAALRLNGIYSDQDPIARVVARGPDADFGDYQRRLGVKAKFLYEPGDRFSLYLIGDYARNRGIGGSNDLTFRSVAAGSVNTGPIAADGVTPGPDNLELGYSAPYDGLRVDTGGASAEMAYTVSDAVKISNIFAWRAFRAMAVGDGDATSSDGVDASVRRTRYRQFSNETRVAIDAGPLIDGQLGAYWFRSILDENNNTGVAAYGALDPLFAPLFGPANSLTNPYLGLDLVSHTRNNSLAGFGQFNIHPVDHVTLILGGRLTRDSNRTSLVQNQRFYPIPLAAVHYATQERVANTDFSWKVGGQYDLPDIGMGYVTYSRGYKGPAFNETAPVANQPLAIAPEIVHNLEIGVKTYLFDRKLRLNLSAFREIFDDFQVQGADVRTTTFFTGNAAKVKAQGVEIFAEARPVRSLTLNAAATILDSKFVRFPNDRCYSGQAGCTFVLDSSGNRTPSSARFTSTVGATFERPLGDNASWAVSGSWYHRSSINFSSNANPATRLGAIDTFDLSLRTTIDKKLQLALFCRNCTDKRFPAFIGNEPLDALFTNLNTTQQSWSYSSLRTIGVSAGFDF